MIEEYEPKEDIDVRVFFTAFKICFFTGMFWMLGSIIYGIFYYGGLI